MKIKKLNEHAKIPTYATDGSGCFDLYSVDECTLIEGEQEELSIGLSFEIPEDHVMLIFSRSGHGFKEGIRLSNCVGVIDSDYRGEVKVKLHKDENLTATVEYQIHRGDRIAQALVIPVPKVEFELVDELSTTERGEGGFGHTG